VRSTVLILGGHAALRGSSVTRRIDSDIKAPSWIIGITAMAARDKRKHTAQCWAATFSLIFFLPLFLTLQWFSEPWQKDIASSAAPLNGTNGFTFPDKCPWKKRVNVRQIEEEKVKKKTKSFLGDKNHNINVNGCCRRGESFKKRNGGIQNDSPTLE